MALSLVLSLLSATPGPLDDATAERFARLALACVHKEYPNKIAHVLNGPADVQRPSKLTPAFYGCYDWHSSVHGHWLLARLARTNPGAPFAAKARAALEKSLTPKNLAAELAYFEGPGRVSFERPYGIAWLLQLATELREWKTPESERWLKAIAPLEAAAAKRIMAWVPKLSRPIRVGEHDQTAFAFGLILDWAKVAGDTELTRVLTARIETWYASDAACPLAWEPNGQDFLSPCLAEADLLRRVMAPSRFEAWLTAFLPTLNGPGESFLEPAPVSDRQDPKLAHLDGLNLSRAWMLRGIASALPEADARRSRLERAATAHTAAGLEGVTGEFYEGGHWLGSFATYLLTSRGLP